MKNTIINHESNTTVRGKQKEDKRIAVIKNGQVVSKGGMTRTNFALQWSTDCG